MSSLERRLAGGSSNKKISDASPQIEHHIQRNGENMLYPRRRTIFRVVIMMTSAILMSYFFGKSLKCDTSFPSPVPITVDTSADADKDGIVTPLDRRMLKYLRSYSYVPPARRSSFHTFPSKECGVSPRFDGFFSLNSNQRSANNEDKWIYENLFSKDNKNNTGRAPGTFVEIGAFDGMRESNSRFFEACLGWKGLLVEGQPGNYVGVLQNRPFVHKMSFAPSCSAEYERVNKTVQFANYPMTNSGLKGHAKTYDAKPHVDVPCGPFTPVLEDIFAFANRRINFFSLDVEGSENLVLDTIDFTKVMIDVMMIEIENNHCGMKCEVREQVRQKMTYEGYQRYEGLIPKSDIYVHPNSPYQLPTKYTAVSA